MNTISHKFPWGIYIGDLIDNNDSIPLCLDSKQGGFCVLFDESSEQIANNFIENIALKLYDIAFNQNSATNTRRNFKNLFQFSYNNLK